MCGRYALALRPGQVRQMLQDDNIPVDDAPEDDGVGPGAPRQSYNFAPGYHGIVYRADVPDHGAGPRGQGGRGSGEVDGPGTDDAAPCASRDDDGSVRRQRYKLQSMKWGLIPFWTKRRPDYGGMMKTINCRDDSLAQKGGMWNTMKARKRCVVVAQGFYEWLKKDGGRVKVPHFVKRKDGALMCMAGLWDCVQYENDDTKHYTYTIITTDSNKQLRFLHDRMPVILDNGSDELRTWLDPERYEWSKDLQALLKPYDGELDVYPVSKDVGKVGNNSPTFMVPIDSEENKSNIANFFAKGPAKKTVRSEAEGKTEQPEIQVKPEEAFVEADPAGPKTGPAVGAHKGIKREAADEVLDGDEPSKKMARRSMDAATSSPPKSGRAKISATSNGTKTPTQAKQPGAQKITKFFGNSS